MKPRLLPLQSEDSHREGATKVRSIRARTTKKVGRANDMMTGAANHVALSAGGWVDQDGWGDFGSQPIRSCWLPHPSHSTESRPPMGISP